jgi:drug/metabolite transporter (DMT)-like permease
VAVETLPPLGMAAVRFLISGLILLALSGAHRQWPSARQWANATVVGALFFLGNHALVGTAAKQLPSSVVCLIIATEVPIIALLSSATTRGKKLTWRVLGGSALGLLGVGSLFIGQGAGPGALPVAPALMVLGASLSWSTGAIVSQRLEAPSSPMLRSGMQMLCGGVLLTFGSLLRGETFTVAAFSARSVGALAYLILFGSVLAFACYTWLLERVPTDTVATHVFVNPLVATAVGAWLGGEEVRPTQLLAGALILASVLLIILKPRPRALGADVAEHA